jgi:D-xylulose 5-phosphate/D-fructose 6-phosphate phosphoketolase
MMRGCARDERPNLGQPGSAARVLGEWLRDVIAANSSTFRLFGPDETESNRLSPVFEATDRAWSAGHEPGDDNLALVPAPGALTSTAYRRKSGNRRACRSWPPLARGFALIRRQPDGGSAASGPASVPVLSNSSSGR